jgi:hypothetical protein
VVDPALRSWVERFRTRTRAAGALVLVLLLGGLGFLPQFAGPGYEAALLAGVVLPSLSAIVSALEGARERSRPVAAILGGAGLGAAFAALGFVTVLLHGARARDPPSERPFGGRRSSRSPRSPDPSPASS